MARHAPSRPLATTSPGSTGRRAGGMTGPVRRWPRVAMPWPASYGAGGPSIPRAGPWLVRWTTGWWAPRWRVCTWELDGAPAWRRDPSFYIQQALGPVFDVLLAPPPLSGARADLVLTRLSDVPRLADQAQANLDDARGPFAKVAIDTLADIDTRLSTLARELDSAVPDHRGRFAGPAAARGAGPWSGTAGGSPFAYRR